MAPFPHELSPLDYERQNPKAATPKHPFRALYAEPGHQWWFAWHPVKMTDGKWAWLRWITRRRIWDYSI